MKYYAIGEFDSRTRAYLKIGSSIEKAINKIEKLENQKKQIIEALLKDIAQLNNMSLDELDCLLESADFLVDALYYGNTAGWDMSSSVRTITKEEYEQGLKNKGEQQC